jgi:hypothetical protein
MADYRKSIAAHGASLGDVLSRILYQIPRTVTALQ